MATNLSLGNQVTVTAKFLDSNNLPLFGFGGEIVWTNDNPNSVLMRVANDNVSVIVVAQSFGTANVTATLGTLSLVNEFVVNTPASGTLIIGPISGANSVIGVV